MLEVHNRECERLKNRNNMCTYVGETGEMCKKIFHHTSGLLYHYKEAHNGYACECCYAIFDDMRGLESHNHDPGANVRKCK